jgi:hypothetical protein
LLQVPNQHKHLSSLAVEVAAVYPLMVEVAAVLAV